MRSTAFKRTYALLLAGGLVIGLAACGDDDAADTSTAGTSVEGDVSGSGNDASSSAIITISGSSFSTSDATAGEPVPITNEDGFDHTVTSDDDAWESVRISGGGHGELPALDPGDYAFHCEIHRSMTGTLTVV